MGTLKSEFENELADLITRFRNNDLSKEVIVAALERKKSAIENGDDDDDAG